MAFLKIETDRGYGWQSRMEGGIPDDTSLDRIRDMTARCCLNGPSRAFLDGAEVASSGKLTARRAKALFGR